MLLGIEALAEKSEIYLTSISGIELGKFNWKNNLSKSSMDENIKLRIKENLKKSIRQFFKNKQVKSYQILDEIFPNERRIRSLIGGLETSLGTTFWEPISKTLAEINGFEIIKEKILIPNPFPAIL